jgi:hypothetical protein
MSLTNMRLVTSCTFIFLPVISNTFMFLQGHVSYKHVLGHVLHIYILTCNVLYIYVFTWPGPLQTCTWPRPVHLCSFLVYPIHTRSYMSRLIQRCTWSRPVHLCSTYNILFNQILTWSCPLQTCTWSYHKHLCSYLKYPVLSCSYFVTFVINMYMYLIMLCIWLSSFITYCVIISYNKKVLWKWFFLYILQITRIVFRTSLNAVLFSI